MVAITPVIWLNGASTGQAEWLNIIRKLYIDY